MKDNWNNEKWVHKKSNLYERKTSESVEPLYDYLTECLGITKIHWFIDFNLSQTIEKFDWITGKAMKFDKFKAKHSDRKILSHNIVINIGHHWIYNAEKR